VLAESYRGDAGKDVFARSKRSVVVDFGAEGGVQVAAEDCYASKKDNSGDVDETGRCIG